MTKAELNEITFRVAARLSVAVVMIFAVPMLVGLHLMNEEQKERISEINDSRAEITYSVCLDQNSRHRETVTRIIQLYEARLKEEPERAQELRESQEATIFLVDALAPERDCEEFVRERFGFVPDVG